MYIWYFQIIKIFVFIFILSVVNGCTALQPFPSFARGGDTITLAVGSPSDMTRANTTASFKSDTDGVPIDITPNIRSIFKLYADPASKVFESTSAIASLVNSSKHSPWITIVAIDLPQGLAVGTGQITFNTTAIYPDIGSHINDIETPINIVPGIGTSSTFSYEFGLGSQLSGDLTMLETQPTAVFGPAIPSISCPCQDYAAIEIITTIPTSLSSLEPTIARVLAEDLSVQTNSGRNFIYSVDGQNLTVIFTSNSEKLKYYEAQFSVVLHSISSFNGTPIINSVRYFDISGNEVSGPISDYNVSIM